MSIQLIRKNFRLAAFAVVAALGVSFMPTQAQAQVRPVVTNCVFQLRAGAHGCGSTVAIQVQRTGVGGAIYWDVRSKLMRPSGALFWSGDVYNMTTGTCTHSVTGSTNFGGWSEWCRVGNVADGTPTFRLMSIAVYPL